MFVPDDSVLSTALYLAVFVGLPVCLIIIFTAVTSSEVEVPFISARYLCPSTKVIAPLLFLVVVVFPVCDTSEEDTTDPAVIS